MHNSPFMFKVLSGSTEKKRSISSALKYHLVCNFVLKMQGVFFHFCIISGSILTDSPQSDFMYIFSWTYFIHPLKAIKFFRPRYEKISNAFSFSIISIHYWLTYLSFHYWLTYLNFHYWLTYLSIYYIQKLSLYFLYCSASEIIRFSTGM